MSDCSGSQPVLREANPCPVQRAAAFHHRCARGAGEVGEARVDLRMQARAVKERGAFKAQQVRAETGLGASKASGH